MRKWNLLVIGEKNGLVGAINDNHPSSPQHIERVSVVEIAAVIKRLESCGDDEDIDQLIQDLKSINP